MNAFVHSLSIRVRVSVRVRRRVEKREVVPIASGRTVLVLISHRRTLLVLQKLERLGQPLKKRLLPQTMPSCTTQAVGSRHLT